MTTRTRVTPESVLRAMDLHKANGLIRDWRPWANAPWKRGGTEPPFYLLVDLAGGGEIELRNLREAAVFTHALASAHRAILRGHAVIITAGDGTLSVAAPFPGLVQAEGWAADLELASNGDLAGQAAAIENPAEVPKKARA
jgi:hypothetical protein